LITVVEETINYPKIEIIPIYFRARVVFRALHNISLGFIYVNVDKLGT
jgi:hypothetical protein